MNQAQQSTKKSVRDVKSWTALVIAQPDNGSSLSSSGSTRYSFFQNLISGSAVMKGPSGTAFDKANNDVIEDKDGAVIAQNAYWQQGAWVGINRTFCQEVVCPIYSSCVSSAAGNICSTSCADITDGWDKCVGFGSYSKDAFCNIFGHNCSGYANPEPLSDHVAFGPYSSSNGNSWSSFSSNTPGGILTLLNQSQCTQSSGFDFATDCNGGTFFNANGSQAKPVICVSNY